MADEHTTRPSTVHRQQGVILFSLTQQQFFSINPIVRQQLLVHVGDSAIVHVDPALLYEPARFALRFGQARLYQRVYYRIGSYLDFPRRRVFLQTGRDANLTKQPTPPLINPPHPPSPITHPTI